MTGQRVAAIAVWSVSWGLAITALVLRLVFDLPASPVPGVFLSPAPVEVTASFDDIGITVALVYGPVSALILARRPHPVGVILAVHAVGSGIAAFGMQWGLLAERFLDLPLAGLLAFAAGWGFVPGTFMTAALPLLVTRDRVPRGQLLVVWVCVGVASAAWIASLTQQSVARPVNPLAVNLAGYQAVVPMAYTALSFAAVAISVISCAVLAQRWRLAEGRDRTAVAWLAIGHLFLTTSYAALVLPAALPLPRWIVEFTIVGPVVGQVLYPAAIVVVILGQRLWGVELVVSRIMLWALLSIGGVLVYLVVVLLVPAVVPGAGAAWIIAPVAVALAVQPLRTWLQRRIDRLVYGEGDDPVVLLSRLGDRIGDLEPGAAGLRQLSDALQRVLRLGAVDLLPGAVARGVEAAGPGTVNLRLLAGDQPVGTMSVRAPDGQRLDRRTLAALTNISGVLAVAVRLTDSHASLEQARSALVAQRAEERRSLRGELHDGLGPALAGIGYGLAAAQNLLSVDPQRAEHLLADLSDDLQRRVRDVRDLANEVTPSALEGRSLPAGLAAIARRFDSPDLRVSVTVSAHRPVPAPIEEAAYLIAAEALTNAVRHAFASTIDLEVRYEPSSVSVRVIDDGVGIAAQAPAGVGMTSMRARAQGLSGEFRVTRLAPGTEVSAVLPLRPGAIRDNGPYPAGPQDGQARSNRERYGHGPHPVRSNREESG